MIPEAEIQGSVPLMASAYRCDTLPESGEKSSITYARDFFGCLVRWDYRNSSVTSLN